MRIRWRLRMAAVQREVWTGAQLRRLLRERAGLELSAAAVSALLTKEPAQVAVHPGGVVHRAGVHPQRLVRGGHHPGPAAGPAAQGGARGTQGGVGARPSLPPL